MNDALLINEILPDIDKIVAAAVKQAVNSPNVFAFRDIFFTMVSRIDDIIAYKQSISPDYPFLYKPFWHSYAYFAFLSRCQPNHELFGTVEAAFVALADRCNLPGLRDIALANDPDGVAKCLTFIYNEGEVGIIALNNYISQWSVFLMNQIEGRPHLIALNKANHVYSLFTRLLLEVQYLSSDASLRLFVK